MSCLTQIKKIELIPTEKIIDLCMKESPNRTLISFKYQEGKTLAQLEKIAAERIQLGHHKVIVNDLSLNKVHQVCYVCNKDALGVVRAIRMAEGKINIARMIADEIERDYLC